MFSDLKNNSNIQLMNFNHNAIDNLHTKIMSQKRRQQIKHGIKFIVHIQMFISRYDCMRLID